MYLWMEWWGYYLNDRGQLKLTKILVTIQLELIVTLGEIAKKERDAAAWDLPFRDRRPYRPQSRWPLLRGTGPAARRRAGDLHELHGGGDFPKRRPPIAARWNPRVRRSFLRHRFQPGIRPRKEVIKFPVETKSIWETLRVLLTTPVGSSDSEQ